MKRHLLGCFALWMLTTSAMAQDPASGTVPRRIPARTPAATPAARPVTPAAPAQAVPTTAPQFTPTATTQVSPLQQSPEPLLPNISPSAMTPELYLYLQDQKRHDDPSQAVRRKAELKAAQRMNRMAAMKWFGMSNARPTAGTIPTMGVYSPAWIGNGYDRFDWVGGAYPSASVYIENETVVR